MANIFPFNRTLGNRNLAGICSLPYNGLSKNLPAKLQFAGLLRQTDMHIL